MSVNRFKSMKGQTHLFHGQLTDFIQPRPDVVQGLTVKLDQQGRLRAFGQGAGCVPVFLVRLGHFDQHLIHHLHRGRLVLENRRHRSESLNQILKAKKDQPAGTGKLDQFEFRFHDRDKGPL